LLFPKKSPIAYTDSMLRVVLSLLLTVSAGLASAQDKGSVDPKPLPPLEHPDDPKVPAKQLFARKVVPLKAPSQVIGFYSKGCIAGAQALPINGPHWQVMRLSRNRMYGHPDLIAFLHRLSEKLPRVSDWHGILIGDMSQPRGGPMLNGHTSHQVGLDADIWLTPMPDRELTRLEREEMSATMVVRDDRLDVDPEVWTKGHLALIKSAAEDSKVERILVNPAIKKALCREAKGDRTWLYKVRPFWGHDYHMHVRIRCPGDSPECKPQDPPKDEDGCGADLAKWFKEAIVHPKPEVTPPPQKKPLIMADLPPACRDVVHAP
jgi:penicillin-insensitive murein endopeptidase